MVAVFAPNLTREAVYDALYARKCYATTGARIYLDFTVDGKPMGSDIENASGIFKYKITVLGTDNIASVELVRTGKNETIYESGETRSVFLEGEIRDSGWAYIKVIQTDRNMAWSSPVWLEKK